MKHNFFQAARSPYKIRVQTKFAWQFHQLKSGQLMRFSCVSRDVTFEQSALDRLEN